MEDFGFKLQNTDTKNNNLKGIIRIILILLSVIIFVVLIMKVFKSLSNNNNLPPEGVKLIKSNIENIKRKPENEGGLNVDNLNVSVYDVIDNNKNDNSKPVIKKTEQTVELSDTQQSSSPNKNDQNMLNQKIGEINSDTKAENKDINTQQINNKIDSNQNINININNNKKSTTNVDDLQKLGNKALIKNLKANKDIKPGIKVQLLALKSREALVNYWNDINSKYSKIFEGKSYYIEQVNSNQPDSIYRLQIGNFSSTDSANDFCKKYILASNKTKMDCIIAK